ncbi:MAG: hypothetical protein A3F91_12370 [Flavobacteria bacterium RIFCSPLOWO2_12_FULL_35_11]|nr:MAG: hypothetical protein A3F91_12370 [Flavobacteria bacterium RIFCSPLOWO2_12_FULL_35_11]
MKAELLKNLEEEISLLEIRRKLITEEIDKDIESLKTTLSYYQRKEWNTEQSIPKGIYKRPDIAKKIVWDDTELEKKEYKIVSKAKPSNLNGEIKIHRGNIKSQRTIEIIEWFKTKDSFTTTELAGQFGLSPKEISNICYANQSRGIIRRTSFGCYDVVKEDNKTKTENKTYKKKDKIVTYEMNTGKVLSNIEQTRNKTKNHKIVESILKPIEADTTQIKTIYNSITPSREELSKIPIIDATKQFKDYKGEIIKVNDDVRILTPSVMLPDDNIEFPDCPPYSNAKIIEWNEGSNLLSVKISGMNNNVLVYPHWLRKLQA